QTSGPEVAAHAVTGALARAGVEGRQVDDVVLGGALQEGTTGVNVARQAVLRAALGKTVRALPIGRQGASGLLARDNGDQQVVSDGMFDAVGGGVESISLVQIEHHNVHRAKDPWLAKHRPSIYLSMLETAEIVAEKYNVTREQQDEFALLSQQQTAAAQRAG